MNKMDTSDYHNICFLLLFVLLCQTQAAPFVCDQRDLFYNQNYYDFKDNFGSVPTSVLRGSGGIYSGQVGKDVIFNITAPGTEVVEVRKLCAFTRNVISVNARSTVIYGTIDNTDITGSGVVDGNHPVNDSNKWEKTCIKPYLSGKVNQVRVQFRIRVPNKKKVRIQKLLMVACRVLN